MDQGAVMKWIALAAALMAVSGASLAETVLCIPEAAATVKQQRGSIVGAGLETSAKFILSNESGNWVVKHHPSGAVIFGNCRTEYFCDAGEMFAGGFFRERPDPGSQSRSVFTAFWITADNSSSYANVAKGYCSSL